MAALEAHEVLGQPERVPRIHRDHFVDAVAEDEAAVEHRDVRVLERHELAVQIYDFAHVSFQDAHLKRSRRLSQPRPKMPAIGDLFQGYHREFAVRLAVELDAQHADLLARGDRREQRLLRFDASPSACRAQPFGTLR